MRRSLALLALIAVPLTACAGGTTTSAAQTSSASAAMSSGDAAMTEAMTEAMASGSGSAGAMAESSGSMMDHPESTMMTEDSMHPSNAMTAEPPAAVPATGVTITTAGSDFGQVLFDGTGQAIYLFDRDTTSKPDCYGDCAAAWPPVLTDGAPVAAAEAMVDLLGTTPRTDGSTQVTYAGHPLYYYAHEGKNVVTCHNVSEFGGLWLAVTPTGQAAA
jgi:predicted lipoprotein with Yx(FWY)xxD motif